MRELILYLNNLESEQQELFARRCGTSVAYLRKAAYTGQQLGCAICVALERESGGALRLDDLFPDVDWAYVRGTSGGTSGGTSQ